ncbi:MAG: hypothetical protein ABI776_12825 [Nocardioidaceae bacterium]
MTAVLSTGWVAVLAAFVGINTVMYAALAVARLLPKLYLSDWFTSPNRRTVSRGIHPEAAALPPPLPPPPPPGRAPGLDPSRPPART